MELKDWTGKFAGKKIFWILPGLTVLFFMDDLLMVLLVEKLKIFRVSDSFYQIVMVWLFLASAVLSYAVFFIMRRKPTTGALGMIGREGKTLGRKNGFWQIDVHGEIWRCECSESLRVGDHVRIAAVEGITLKVTKTGKRPWKK